MILALLLVYHGWRAALLALFFIGLGRLLRYIANDVDRIGWSITTELRDQDIDEDTRSYQRRMLWLLLGLTQAQNIALVTQATFFPGRRRPRAWSPG